MNYQNKLKPARMAAGLTQLQLAIAANVGLATLSRLENYPLKTSPATAVKLAIALGTEPGTLFPYYQVKPTITANK